VSKQPSMVRTRVGIIGVLLAGLLVVPPGQVSAQHGTPFDLAEEAAGLPTAAGDPVDAPGHLARIMDLSPAPEFRRFGTGGMAAVAEMSAEVLGDAGYSVVRPETSHEQWKVSYAATEAPLLRRSDDTEFVVESAFGRRAADGSLPDLSTDADGVTCTVVPAADVEGSGHCGFVPFDAADPEWNNFTANARALIDQIAGAGGSGVVVQGDASRDMVFAQQVRTAIPTVVAAVEADEVLGHEVLLRTRGTWVPDATVRNVVGVLPEPSPGAGYVAVTAHADAWFQGAVDNGAGHAAALDAAEALARLHASGELDVGVVVALFDAEEVGLIGSGHVAELLNRPEGLVVPITPGSTIGVHMSDLLGVVNLDAPSAKPSDVHGHEAESPIASHGVPVFSWRALIFSDPHPADHPEPYASAGAFGAEFVATFGSHGVFGLPVPSSGWNEFSGGWRTDAQHFHEAGVPVVWPVAGYPEYHTNLDVYDPTGERYSTVDPTDLQAVADAAVDWVDTVRSGRLRPSARLSGDDG